MPARLDLEQQSNQSKGLSVPNVYTVMKNEALSDGGLGLFILLAASVDRQIWDLF